MRLGKLPPRASDPEHRVTLARYLGPEAQADDVVDWTRGGFAWSLGENDVLATCGPTCAENMRRVWTFATAEVEERPDQVVVDAYKAVGGYDPARPESDTGVVLVDLLRYWRDTGIAGERIDGVARVSVQPDALRVACTLFGCVMLGLALPVRTQDAGDTWAAPATLAGDDAPGSWGGHCVALVGYDQTAAKVISWGRPKDTAWGYLSAYGDEAWVALSGRWFGGGVGGQPARTPAGLLVADLCADMDKLGRSG